MTNAGREPYYLTILGANGYLIAYQVDHSKAVPATEWAEHPVGPGVQLPATVHAVDPETGRAILARIGPNGDVKAEMTN
ncbi:hypothetical protein GOD68_17945 [Sinorhizobium medicae]|nr:hypothetical protein [Sinorhizobium medicae]MDX0671888.1 hypothetical protein [Sinorhizobium medicae]MDX0709168.1 hypothetical protein [Sinorhizobium medicae]